MKTLCRAFLIRRPGIRFVHRKPSDGLATFCRKTEREMLDNLLSMAGLHAPKSSRRTALEPVPLRQQGRRPESHRSSNRFGHHMGPECWCLPGRASCLGQTTRGTLSYAATPCTLAWLQCFVNLQSSRIFLHSPHEVVQLREADIALGARLRHCGTWSRV